MSISESSETTESQPTDRFNTQTLMSQRIYRLAFNVAVLAVFALGLTWLCRGLLVTAFDLSLDNRFWLRDYMGNLVVVLLCLALVQGRTRTMILASVVIIGFQMANGGKLSILGTPISPDDFFNIQNLFFLTEGWRQIALMFIAALPLLTALILIPYKRISSWITLGVLAVCVLLVGHFSEPIRATLDKQFGNSVWNQPENFRRRGLALHVTQEIVRTVAKVGHFPSRESVLQATSELPARHSAKSNLASEAAGDAQQPQRNVHVIVLESFYDPMTLGPEWVPEDPLPQSFRDLWATTGNSKALSPVFGGYTANAEFETLCGFPVTENAVFFEGWLRRQAPCLPQVLRDVGYKAVASHPNVPGFWNRTHAYSLVGFEQYLSKTDFELKDSVDGLLLDHSLFDQVFSNLAKQDNEQPVFNYMLTYYGHLPYPTNDAYPDKVKTTQDAPLLHGYLNQLWYKSRDLMARIEALQQEDPDALIVAFGDHLPFLGQNYGVYSDVLNLPSNRAEFTGDMLEYLVSTPLIVIDGKNGPLNAGKLPLYRLPALILSLLGLESEAGMLNWTENPEGSTIRPVYGMHITLGKEDTFACPDDDSAPVACEESADWLTRTRVLISDIFSGKQFGLQTMGTTGGS